MKIRKTLNQAASFRYRVGFIRDGKRHLVTPWKNNLIQDCGLDGIGANYSWGGAFAFALFGDAVSPVPTRRDSAPITFTTSGGGNVTCTASAPFFDPSDVGRLIKFNDGPGTEVYITGYTSNLIVTVQANIGIVAQTGTVWYVNETALTSVYSTSNTYGASGGDNGTIKSGATYTNKRTIVGAPVGGAVTLTEIGFNNSAANVNVFDRDIITGGVPLITGDQPLAICELIITYSPSVSTAVGNVATGYDSSGNMIFSGLQSAGADEIDAAGAAQFGNLSPVNGSYLSAWLSNVALDPFSNGAGRDVTAEVSVVGAGTLAAYSNGNFYRDQTSHFTIAQAIGTIYGAILPQVSFGVYTAGWEIKFTTPPTKTTSQILDFVMRKTWQRVLTN